ncbi:MAG TPA: dihydrofolate reductase family protein [Lysobacter sp.]|nr:dihydrofolate reductase family protein [Lysobacter sp.]
MPASVYIATSLDGFIARENGDLDWLNTHSGGTDDGGDYGYGAFMAGIDALVMGRGTYEKVLTFGGWPYGDKPVVVLSHRPVEFPGHVPACVEAMSGTPQEIVSALASRGWHRLYVDGGKTVQAFLDAGLVDRLIISRIPVLIGRGIPLFGPLSRDIRLRHVDTRAYANGLVQSEYAINPPASA